MKALPLFAAAVLLPTLALAQNVINPNFSSQGTPVTSNALTTDIKSSQDSLAKAVSDHQDLVNNVKATLSGPGAEQAGTIYKSGAPYSSSQTSSSSSASGSTTASSNSYKIILDNQSSKSITVVSAPIGGSSNDGSKAEIKANMTAALLTPGKKSSLSVMQSNTTASCGTTEPNQNYQFTITGVEASLACNAG